MNTNERDAREVNLREPMLSAPSVATAVIARRWSRALAWPAAGAQFGALSLGNS
jgi:hypothetical protein